MKLLNFKVITNIEEAKYMWDLFSPHKAIDDEWNFRHVFYKYLNFPLHFIVGYDDTKPIGLLPLQLNKNKGMSAIRFGMNASFLEFFGGIDTDDNKVFLLPGYEQYVPEFLEQVKVATVLAPLSEGYVFGTKIASYYTDRFVADLKGIKTLDMFIESNFEGKSKRRLRNRINYFYNNYDITIKKGTEIDLELMFSLNKDRFGKLSAFHLLHRRKIFRDIIKLYNPDLFTVFIDGDPKAVSLSLVHKGIYTGLNSGYDYSFKDLGKFVFITKIQQAIALGCSQFDAGKNDNGWKEHFHLTKIPQYRLDLNLHLQLQYEQKSILPLAV